MNNILIKSKNLTVGYGEKILLKNADFEVKKGDIFVIMGGSGCGKSSLLKVLTGLMEPLEGSFELFGIDYKKANDTKKFLLKQKTGILYQSGALFSSMTLYENVAMPLNQYTSYSDKTIEEFSSARLDELMLEISANLGTTLVVVTHELESIFTIANNSIYLDSQTKTITASGNPHEILKNPPNERVFQFLTRGKNNEKGTE